MAQLQATGITGSFTVITGSAVELQVTNLGVNIGSATVDNHNVTGSLRVSGSIALTGASSMTGQLTNTLATGTAPFAITSTTRVANLNVATAGTADTWTTGRTITIGSTGKSVNGSANVSWSLAEIGAQAALTNPVTGTGTSGQVAYFTGTSAISSESNLFWDATNDRLGIGNASPSFTLDVNGNTRAERYRGINSLTLNTYTTVNPSSNVFLYSQPNDRDAWIFLDSADTGSNWGIYHRQIDSTVSNLPGNSLGFIGGGANTLQSYISLASGDAYFRGSLGIGTTTPGSYKLYVLGGQFGTYLQGGDTGTGSDIVRMAKSDGSIAMLVRGDGNIGIGTTSPQSILDVITPANGYASFSTGLGVGQFTGIHFGYRENNTAYRKSAIVFQRTDLTANNAQGKVHILNGPQGDACSATLADARLTIAENGNVGINSTSPASRLSVCSTTACSTVVDVQGCAGQLFSVTDNLVGDIFSVSDISGIPILNVNSNGTVCVDSKIAVGANHTVSGNYATVTGGRNNTASGACSTVGGGEGNTASGYASVVAGGGQIFSGCAYGNTASGNWSTIGGGRSNTACGCFSTISGGYANTACSSRTTVAGGASNTASGYASSVGGGRENCSTGNFSTVAGGFRNTASGYASVVAGGGACFGRNCATARYATVSGGRANTASAYYATVGGGGFNTASGCYSTVSGGYSNSAGACHSTIGGGIYNSTFSMFGTGNCAVVAGGQGNSATANYAVVSGGCGNIIQAAYAGILGGQQNTVQHDCSFIIGSCITATTCNYTFVNNLCNVGGGTSDCRLKENINPIPYGLSELSRLQPVCYNFKTDESKAIKYGFLAQCVQAVMPDLIKFHPTDTVDGDKVLQFEKEAIWASMVNAIKELKQRVEELESKLN